LGVTFYSHTLISLAITAHWIDDDWNLHEALLDFVQVTGRHQGVRLAAYVLKVMEEYDICQKLFCITCDNAGNNNTMGKEISRYLKEKYNINWNWSKNHIQCLNHVINLAVQDFLKSIKGITIENDGWEDEEDKEVDVEEDEVDGNHTFHQEGFAMAMHKIRELIKV
jgi:hypothetical protein